jgi:hypothetical protein
MASYFEPIIVQIEDGTANINSGGGAKGNSGMQLGKLVGAIDVLQEIMGLVKEAVKGILAPLSHMVTGILKLVAQFIRPAVDVLMILLIPILNILKPLVKVFNDIMRPFRQIAFKMAKEGGIAGALAAPAIILQGLMTAVLNVVAQFIKSSMFLITDLLKRLIFYPLADILPGVSREGVDKAFQGIQDAVNTVLDNFLLGGGGFPGINKLMLDSAKNVARGLGVSVDNIDYATPMKKAQKSAQSSLDEFWAGLRTSSKGSGSSNNGVKQVTVNMQEVNAHASTIMKNYGITNGMSAAEAIAAATGQTGILKKQTGYGYTGTF